MQQRTKKIPGPLLAVFLILFIYFLGITCISRHVHIPRHYRSHAYGMDVQNAICLDSGHRSIAFGTPEYRCHRKLSVYVYVLLAVQLAFCVVGGAIENGPRTCAFPSSMSSPTCEDASVAK